MGGVGGGQGSAVEPSVWPRTVLLEEEERATAARDTGLGTFFERAIANRVLSFETNLGRRNVAMSQCGHAIANDTPISPPPLGKREKR